MKGCSVLRATERDRDTHGGVVNNGARTYAQRRCHRHGQQIEPETASERQRKHAVVGAGVETDRARQRIPPVHGNSRDEPRPQHNMSLRPGGCRLQRHTGVAAVDRRHLEECHCPLWHPDDEGIRLSVGGGSCQGVLHGEAVADDAVMGRRIDRHPRPSGDSRRQPVDVERRNRRSCGVRHGDLPPERHPEYGSLWQGSSTTRRGRCLQRVFRRESAPTVFARRKHSASTYGDDCLAGRVQEAPLRRLGGPAAAGAEREDATRVRANRGRTGGGRPAAQGHGAHGAARPGRSRRFHADPAQARHRAPVDVEAGGGGSASTTSAGCWVRSSPSSTRSPRRASPSWR